MSQAPPPNPSSTDASGAPDAQAPRQMSPLKKGVLGAICLVLVGSVAARSVLGKNEATAGNSAVAVAPGESAGGATTALEGGDRAAAPSALTNDLVPKGQTPIPGLPTPGGTPTPVSYTHLTLPTIYSV